MHLQKTNNAFSKRITQRGHTRAFRLVNDHVDKDFAGHFRKDEVNIYDWIRQVYRDSRGSELSGTVNPAVL